ncbi:MAG: orotate phosphoribosyltransferase [Acidimicrobiales bacterium]
MDTKAPESAGAPIDLGDLRGQLRKIVLSRGYERREEAFRLSSGGTSHDYVDLRRAVARGEDLDVAARCVVAALAEAGVEYDVIGGMTMGADPVAHGVALVAGRAWFSVRKAPKDHGTARRTEGADLTTATRAVVFEDTVSTGASLLGALEVVMATPADVVGVCTLLDRGESLAERLEGLGLGVPFVRVLTYEDLGIEPL